ncbi:MAG: TorF family putative porin [Gammaproteobacteria bacterium]|jgi:uncharacterized protein (TIGR02001 family)
MHLSKTLLASALLAATGAAQAEVSANLGVASNYYFRGVSQTGDAAAVSGGLDYNHDSGFYLGTWASNIDFGDDSKADMEIDFYTGFGGDIGASGFTYDLSGWYYWYPGAGGDEQGGDLDYAEASGSLGWQWITGTVAYTFWGENDDDVTFTEDDVYYNLTADLPMEMAGFSPSVFIGYYDFDCDGNDACGNASYTHWGLGISKDAGEFGAFSVTYEQTDGGEGDAVATDENPNFWIGWAKDF